MPAPGLAPRSARARSVREYAVTQARRGAAAVTDEKINVDGQQLRVSVRHGDQDRVPLLLINGVGAPLDALQPFVDALDPR